MTAKCTELASMLFICNRWVGLMGFKGDKPFQKEISHNYHSMRGRQKNVICKGQWFPLIYMTAVKYTFDIKRAFLYFSCPKKKTCFEASWAVFWSMSGYKEDTTLSGLHTLPSSRCKIVASELRACIEGKISK